MKLGITGTRKGANEHQEQQFIKLMKQLNPTELHHGACVGVDSELAEISRVEFPHVTIFYHPPQKQTSYYYLKRNREIVNETDMLLAFPFEKESNCKRGSGTWYTVNYAKRQGKPVTICYRCINDKLG
jgi:hypothetical protein